MLLPLTLAVVVIAMILLALFGGGETIMGLEPGLLASLVSGAAFAVLVLSGSSGMVRGRMREAARDLALWALILFAALAAYAYRFELQEVGNRVLAEIAPGHTVMARGGEATIARSRGGSFLVAGKINGRDARFIFDTGATAVVLTDATARAVGLDPSTLTYDVGVATANGRTTAARVRLDRLAVGPISEARVEALVARPGALTANLLGMSFLERLASYEVRDDKLILRGGR